MNYRVTDKEALVALLDRANIDQDVAKAEVTIKVNGSEVTGTEGGQVIFKFGSRGQLTGIVVWNSNISDQKSEAKVEGGVWLFHCDEL